HDVERTNEKFIPNPLDNGETKLYRTGDLVRYLEDGNIEYIGRIDNQVKIRGFRIELGEIEALLNTYPQVEQAVVIAREDIPGDKRLVAYLATKVTSITSRELREFIKDNLPEYMIPSAFVCLDSLPLTPSGKVNRRALPAPDYSEIKSEYVAPCTPTEEILTGIWTQVLKVERVGINDNFFEIGGHSLLATQLVSRIRQSFQVEIPLQRIFANGTVAELASLIEQLQKQQLEIFAQPILPRVENAELPLSFAQQRLWFINQFEPNSASYNIPLALHLEGNLNQSALEKSLLEIINRHESLRTNFVNIDGQAVQIIHPQTSGKVSVIDLRQLTTSEREKAVKELLKQQINQGFNLESESLIRITLILLSDTENILSLCMHHIISDGWSMGVFVDELTTLYNAYIEGKETPLTALEIQYADFAIWQRNWLQGEVLARQLTYWKQQLETAPKFLQLPTDRPRPAVQTFVGKYHQFSISQELSKEIEKLSQKQGV
ncbi:MAG: non-ribosomal peptide synthetase, partial [Nostocales cyanobacterium]